MLNQPLLPLLKPLLHLNKNLNLLLKNPLPSLLLKLPNQLLKLLKKAMRILMMRSLMTKILMNNLKKMRILMRKMLKMIKMKKNKSLPKNPNNNKADLNKETEDLKAKVKENLSDKAKSPNSTTIEVETKEDTKVEINLGKIRVDKVETGKITTKEAIKEETSHGKTREARVVTTTGRITTIREESPSTKVENLSTTDTEMINFPI